MKESFLISLIVITIYIYLYFSKKRIVYIKSNFDNLNYLVRNEKSKEKAAILLSKLVNNIFTLIENVCINKNKEFKKYLVQLENNVSRMKTKIYENNGSEGFTSYTVNKGEEIVFCLRSNDTKSLHSLNLIMYVAIHELAHCACPETGHGSLFQKIFKFLTEEAVKYGLYKKIDYSLNPIEYCGMILSTSII